MAYHRLQTIIKLSQIFTVLVAILFGAGLIIGSDAQTPKQAPILADDVTKTVIAYQCVSEWVDRSPAPDGVFRPTTFEDPSIKNYSLDDSCIQTGIFAEDGPNLDEILLIKLGLWPRPQYWWDNPNVSDMLGPINKKEEAVLPFLYGSQTK